MNATLHHRGSDADLCRANGWRKGTRLVGDEGYGPTVIELTAIGCDDILAKTIGHAGIAHTRQRESSWVLWCREWRKATDADMPTPLALGERVQHTVWGRVKADRTDGVIVALPSPERSYYVFLDWTGRALIGDECSLRRLPAQEQDT